MKLQAHKMNPKVLELQDPCLSLLVIALSRVILTYTYTVFNEIIFDPLSRQQQVDTKLGALF